MIANHYTTHVIPFHEQQQVPNASGVSIPTGWHTVLRYFMEVHKEKPKSDHDLPLRRSEDFTGAAFRDIVYVPLDYEKELEKFKASPSDFIQEYEFAGSGDSWWLQIGSETFRSMELLFQLSSNGTMRGYLV